MTAELNTAPLSPACGSRIEGLDLKRISDDQLAKLRGLVGRARRAVRGGPEPHAGGAHRLRPALGEIDINNYFPTDPTYPEIALVKKEKGETTNIGGRHTDHSYDRVPAMGSILLARETPPTGGDTLFASMYAAYEGLSDGLKNTLSTLRAVHSADDVYGPQGFYAHTDIAETLKDRTSKTGAVHPVVISHPVSGRKALFVNPAFTISFEGWTREEACPCSRYLDAQAMREEITCRLQWKPGSSNTSWSRRRT